MDKLSRTFAKTRFATALPLAAALLAAMLAVLFITIFSIAAEARSIRLSDRAAQQMAEAVSVELQNGDTAAVRTIVETAAPETALITDGTGAVIAGAENRALLTEGRKYPLVQNGEEIGLLHAGRIVQGGLPLPLPALLASTLFITGLAYWLANYFAGLASSQLMEINSTLKRMSAGRASRSKDTPLVFEEFRSLRAELVRSFHRLKGENRRLSQAAYSDERTGLGNAARLTNQLTEFISRCSFEEPAAYILIEAEGFQTYSDAQSTLLPNDVHAAMARRISQFVAALEEEFSMPSGSWPVFALQSDEFAIVVDRLGARGDVMRFVRRLLEALRQPYDIAGQTIRLSPCAGIAILPEDGQSPLEVRKRAESALYQARRSEDLNFQFYSPKFDRQAAARKRLESEVRAAVEANRFVPVFQPKVDLRTGRIVGSEALARWKLESGRIVSPNVFIPVAESMGLISRIGMQITEQACHAAARWHREGFRDVSVAVNVSPLQFESDDLGAMIINAMSEAGLPPKLMQLEITESVAVSDPDRLRDVISPLKSMGVRLAMDDFGTGHSNLSLLGRLPFDVFKIDRSFISSLYTDKQAPAIVEMILGMAETLGMETVAEGVETEAQEKFLRHRGCDQYQGYFYSPPVSLEKFLEMLVKDQDCSSANAG
ncbi:bifunctional diguanylate cyclase/phosphodiesterase [Henriciella sp.]|uniref:putative bifunctional diguanylate cyclase/phosphodiesterase n=1 Tax=Henriciella sp. TaxID=1968823 RepID=UPI0026271FA2|nr:GGDEF domain-containing phosphodiesterase [Henriciella sp.]